MELRTINDLLTSINGCTFASIDSTTSPLPGLTCKTYGANVILFTNANQSGYEAMVKRRLEEIGKDPESFTVSGLPWGERVTGTPLIVHKSKMYLQTILLAQGRKEFFIGKHPVNPSDLDLRRNQPNQGLPLGRQVVVNTYALESIDKIMLLGETVEDVLEEPVAEGRARGQLTIRYPS